MQLPITTVNTENKISIGRSLPFPGEILVQPGQQVEALTPIAKSDMPSRYQVIALTRYFSNPGLDMAEALEVEQGQSVQANQVVATLPGGLPFLRGGGTKAEFRAIATLMHRIPPDLKAES